MSKGANGVLPAPSTIMKKSDLNTTPATRPMAKAPEPKLKLILRRLPPGLTQTELEIALGDEWRTGGGKIEWFAYKQGKISKDLAKPSHPSRAYFKVKDPSFIAILSDKVNQTNFQDAKNSSKDSSLLGPPSLEFAPYSRVPGTRVRKDGRQGTIDQEQEFIDFLHGLTEPVAKSLPQGDATENVDPKAEKVITTPLIQYLKEKKANKSKEAAAAKAAKAQSRQEAKEQKAAKVKAEEEAKKAAAARKEANNAAMAEKQARIEKAKLEAQAAKVAQKQAAAIMAKQSVDSASASPSLTKAPTAPTSIPSPTIARRERERGNARVAAAILQRDLGLTGSPRAPRGAHRNAAHQTSEPPKTIVTADHHENKPSPDVTPTTQPASQTPSKPSTSESTSPTTPAQAPTGPRNTTKTFNSPATRTPANVTRRTPAAKSTPQPSPGAKSAFLKHANPSQGVTEPLLQEAFSAFGTITKCEIDKKKGFGYVDFADPDGLQKAMKNSPIKVGNGQVVVLERKDKPTPKASFPNTNKPTPNAAPPVRTATPPAAAAVPAPEPGSTPAPPTAPRGSATPTGPGRGGMRGGMTPRGGFSRGSRGGFRGGRGSFRGATSGGGGTAASPAPQTAQPAASGEGK